MSYLGYDRELLGALRRAARRSSDQLALLQSADVEAIDAISTLVSCRRTLDDQWLPVMDGLLGCVALDGRNPVSLDPADLRLAVMFDRQQSGWHIVNDPLIALVSNTVTPDEARAIGLRLHDDDAVDELTADELIWLAERLDDIADDPAATKAFRSVFDGDGAWAPLLDRLGLDRADQADRAVWDSDDRSATDRVTQLDAVVTPLAQLYSAGAHTLHAGPWFPTVIDQLDPYTAGLVLRELDLDPHVAARAADEVLQRWMTGHDDDRMWIDQSLAGDNTADLLFAWLTVDAQAARCFIERAAAHPEIIFRTTRDDASVNALVAAGTDLSVMSVASAGRTIPPLLAWSVDHESTISPAADGGIDNIRSVMAIAVGPWLMQLTSRSDDWSWTPKQADDALRWTMQDQTAADRLLVAMDGWQQVLANTRLVDVDGAVDHPALKDLTGLFAAMQLAFRDEEIDDARDAGFWSDNAVLFGAIVVSSLVPGGAAVGVVADLTLAAVSPATQRWLAAHGVLPSSNDGVAEAPARFGDRSAATQVVALVGTVGRLIEAGKLPADALEGLDIDDLDVGSDECPPEVVTKRLNEFVDGLKASTDTASFNGMHDVVDAFGNSLSAAQQCDA